MEGGRRCSKVGAMRCDCKRRLRASDEEGLFGRVVDHLRADHAGESFSEARVREAVAARSYGFEEVAVAGTDAEEEFGIDPY
jgi:predicted small metal-binding protein